MAGQPVVSFGGLLRRLRGEAGLTQEELAAAAGVSVRSVSDLERGVNLTARRDTARLLAGALGLSGAERARFEEAARGRFRGGVAWPAVLPGPGLLAGGPVAAGLPWQVPAAVPHFSGRSGELAVLSRLAGDAGRVAVVVVISGMAGVGKTALAVRFAHGAGSRFPDGQLYADLRGFSPDGQVTDPGQALWGFLDALGVPALGRPVSVDGQAALYRSLLAGRRMLIVLDNARGSDQVRLLLPGSPGCMVLVTSRQELPGIVAGHGACAVSLGVLSPAEASDLLRARLGHERVTGQPEAAGRIIAACAGLPLGLAIVTARAAARPGRQLQEVADELGDARSRLDALAGGETSADIRAVLSWSYQVLTPDAGRVFRLLGLHPGPDISAAAAASLTAVPLTAVRLLLGEMVRAHLADETAPGRYASHDLVRAYAAELADSRDSTAERDAATSRLLDHYVHSAWHAYRALFPHREFITLTAPGRGSAPEAITDRNEAQAWFTAEHRVLLAAVRHAAGTGHDTQAWQLAWATGLFLRNQGRWHDQAAIASAAVTAADRLRDSTARAHSHFAFGVASTNLVRFEQARAHLRLALDLFRQTGDLIGQATSRIAFGVLSGKRGRESEAVAHARKALVLFTAARSPRGQAISLNNIGYSSALLGDHHKALALCQQALAIQLQADDRFETANTWHSVGYAHHHLGQHQQAIDCYQRAIEIYHAVGNAAYEGETLNDLADTHDAAGDQYSAQNARRHALAILDNIAHPDAAPTRNKLAERSQTRSGIPP